MRQEIKLSMESKHHNVAFLGDDNWFNDLAFPTDISQHLSEMKLKQQGKSQLVNKSYEHICALEKKLKLIKVQHNGATVTHFACLAARRWNFLIMIPPPMQQVFKSSQAGFQISDEMRS